MREQLKSQKPPSRISQKVGNTAEKGYGNHKSEFESLFLSPKKCFWGNIMHAIWFFRKKSHKVNWICEKLHTIHLSWRFKMHISILKALRNSLVEEPCLISLTQHYLNLFDHRAHFFSQVILFRWHFVEFMIHENHLGKCGSAFHINFSKVKK